MQTPPITNLAVTSKGTIRAAGGARRPFRPPRCPRPSSGRGGGGWRGGCRPASCRSPSSPARRSRGPVARWAMRRTGSASAKGSGRCQESGGSCLMTPASHRKKNWLAGQGGMAELENTDRARIDLFGFENLFFRKDRRKQTKKGIPSIMTQQLRRVMCCKAPKPLGAQTASEPP